MDKPKVLVGSPIFEGMKYCVDEFLKSITNLDYENYDILIVDNSRGDSFFEELRQMRGINILKDDTTEEKNIFRLISSRNKIIEYAIENDYDYILMIDSDVIVPKETITELINADKDIISGIYYNYFVINGQIKLRPVCWRHISPEEFEEISKQVRFPPIVKSYEDVRRHLTEEEIKEGKVIRVKIPAAGCMLIKKNVFEKIKFGQLEIEGFKPKTGEDIYFFTKAEEGGFGLYCDPKIKCEHLIEGKYKKDEQGNFIHPAFS